MSGERLAGREATNKKPATAEAGRAKLATRNREWTYGCRARKASRVLPRYQDSGTTERKPFYERLRQSSAGIVRLYVWITARRRSSGVGPCRRPRPEFPRKEAGDRAPLAVVDSLAVFLSLDA
ncbi:MAG: hypothetical protein QOC89_1198 [Paraburkholderia sp.]|jgi:hypothetical protein|nr:hypothetical protein [Paraburkholderia sp.]